MFKKTVLFETDNFLGNLTEKERISAGNSDISVAAIENLQNLVSPKDLELSSLNGIEYSPYPNPIAGQGKSVRPSSREEGVRRDMNIQPPLTQRVRDMNIQGVAVPYTREEPLFTQIEANEGVRGTAKGHQSVSKL